MSRKKITAKTANDGWVAPKVRKKRKPMTPEQREAAVERLAKALYVSLLLIRVMIIHYLLKR